jgi:uncharacterized membrane protein
MVPLVALTNKCWLAAARVINLVSMILMFTGGALYVCLGVWMLIAVGFMNMASGLRTYSMFGRRLGDCSGFFVSDASLLYGFAWGLVINGFIYIYVASCNVCSYQSLGAILQQRDQGPLMASNEGIQVQVRHEA